jgi:hypothetical protein
MTVFPDMHNAFRLNLDKSSSLVGNPDFSPEEIDFWLNEAQDRFIKQRVFGNNIRREAFDGSLKRVEDIRNIVINSSSISLSSSVIGSNIKEGVLPFTDANSPYMYYIDSTLFDSGSSAMNVGEPIKITDASKYVKDSINNPYIRRPLPFFYGNKIAFVYGDEFIPTTFTLTYIKKPKQLTYTTVSGYQTNTCELAEETHREIVDIAIGLVIENIESPRVQTYSQINQSNIE